MTKKKNKMGRPKLPKGEAKKIFSLRLSKHERDAIQEAAKKAGEKVTKWARKALLKAVEE
jgi:predicted HicB family RNase H-like nuclease